MNKFFSAFFFSNFSLLLYNLFLSDHWFRLVPNPSVNIFTVRKIGWKTDSFIMINNVDNNLLFP